MEKEGFKALSVVSSPGKVIICGEHAVVYGEDALAMAISLRCSATVSAKESKDLQKPIITFAGSLSCEVNVRTLEEDTQEGFKQFMNAKKKQGSLDEQSIKLQFKVGVFIRETGLSFAPSTAFKVDVRSEIPISKCLGSSASFNTVLVASLFVMAQFRSQHPPQMDLQQVNKLSKLFEKVEHGNPSGVDNYLATFGGVVLYNNSKNPPFTPIRDPSTLEKLVRGVRFRLVDSGVKKNTEKAVGIVRQNYEKDGKYKEMVAQVGTLSQKIIEALGAPGQELESQEWKHSLFEILSINHGYLRELGVSIPEIEEIVERNTVKGAKSSKLTGAGMGGYALVVECPLTVPPSCSDSDIIAEMDLKGLLVEYF